MSVETKGIILAAGKGTRLMPATLPASKPLLPLYDKPMIYYPLETLVRIGIKDILFIVQEDDLPIFQKTFGSGEDTGLNFSYKIQKVQTSIFPRSECLLKNRQVVFLYDKKDVFNSNTH